MEDPGTLRLSTDEKRFVKCISQLAALPLSTENGNRGFKDDMVHKAAHNIICRGQLQTSNIVSLQIFWDIQRELGAMLPLLPILLAKVGQDLKRSYTNYLATEGLDKVGVFHKKFRGEIELRMKHAEAVATDSQIQSWFDDCEEHALWKSKYNSANFSLLECHPEMCGLIMINIHDEHQRATINMAGGQGQIFVAVHLYNAANRSGLAKETVQWADMNALVERQGSEWIFVGAKPDTPQGFVRHLGLAMGLSVTKFAKDYKPPCIGNGSHGYHTLVGRIRHFEYLARYSELSYERVSKQ